MHLQSKSTSAGIPKVYDVDESGREKLVKYKEFVYVSQKL